MFDEPKILIIDDEPRMCESLRQLLDSQNYELNTANSAKEAIEILNNNSFDLILLDLCLPDMNGYRIMDHISQPNLGALVIVLTGYGTEKSAIEALRRGAYDYLKKPLEPDKLLITVKNALNQKKIQRDEELAKTALRVSELRLSRFMNSASDSFYLLDSNLNFIEINQKGLEIIGKDRDDVIGKNITEIVPDIKTSGRYEQHLEAIKTGKSFEMEDFIPHPIFGELHFLLKSFKVGEGLGVITTDITDRKRAEEALKKSEKRYRQLVETMNEGLGVTDQNYIFTYVNPSFCEMLGYHRDEIIGCKLIDFVHDDYKELMIDQIGRRKKGEEGAFELAWKTKGGDKIYTHASPKALYDEEGCFTGSIGILTDITYRIKAEEELRLSEEKYRHLVENANDAIFILQDGKIKFFNNRARLIGIELGIDLDRVPFDQYIHPEDRDMVIDRHIRRLKGEKLSDTYAFRLIGKDGQEMWVELNAVELTWEGKAATLNFLRNITVQRKLEKQLQFSQKMEAVGTLAGGVAHDFNNLLMGIQGRTSLMMLETNSFHPSFKHLMEIEICIQKAAKLTKQLLGFARGGKYEIKPTDLNDLVENSAQMFGRTKKEITYFKKYEEKLWPAAVDQSQIDQVLLNIFVNAWQAMPEGGDLYIQTKNEILDENFVRAYGAAPGKYIKISIMDTGIGMDEKTMKRVFDPFFTTKEKGRGTGFGLASAYGIIKNHDGIITVESAKGEGATFNVYLPASEKTIIREEAYEQKISVGSETILLVDDEAMIIDVSVQMLNKMGYKVLTAHNGKEAIKIFKQNNDKVAIVILDLIMPGMGGGEVYERLKGIDANVKVLLSSGYSVNGQAAEILNRGCDGFIQKPFKLNELSYKLREIISK